MNAVSLLFLYFSYMNLYMFRYVKSYLFFKLFKLNKFIYVSKVLKLLLYSSGVNSNLLVKDRRSYLMHKSSTSARSWRND